MSIKSYYTTTSSGINIGGEPTPDPDYDMPKPQPSSDDWVDKFLEYVIDKVHTDGISEVMFESKVNQKTGEIFLEYEGKDQDVTEILGDIIFQEAGREEIAIEELISLYNDKTSPELDEEMKAKVKTVLHSVGRDDVTESLEAQNVEQYIEEAKEVKEQAGKINFLHKVADGIEKVANLMDAIQYQMEEKVQKRIEESLVNPLMAMIDKSTEKAFMNKYGLDIDVAKYRELSNKDAKAFVNHAKLYGQISKVGNEKEKEAVLDHIKEYGVLKEDMKTIEKPETVKPVSKQVTKE